MRRLEMRLGDSSGMALLITLLVLVILAVLVHRFAFTTRVHLAAAANLRDQLQAECLARSGIEVALRLLEQDEEPDVDHLGEPWADLKASEDLSFLDIPEGSFGLRVEDESGKVNLNFLVDADGLPDPFILEQIVRLLEIFQVTPERLDALLDWLDEDDDRRPEGAEDADYQALDRPYPCRNGLLRTLGELQQVIGWEDLWHIRLEDGTALVDCLTVGPTEGRINVNTASPVVLQSLDSEIDEFLTADILALREEAPLESEQSLLLASGVTEALVERVQEYIQVNASLVSIHCEGNYRRATARVHALVMKSGEVLTPIRWRTE